MSVPALVCASSAMLAHTIPLHFVPIGSLVVHLAVTCRPCGVADQLAVSSLHLTFNTAEEARSLTEAGYLQRTGIQYHWENRNYVTFEDFLADLKQSKRKNIRQVCSSGVSF